MRPPEAGGDEPLVLALDTASASGGVALVRGRAVLGEASWQVGGQQTSEVLPAAVRLWERAGITAQTWTRSPSRPVPGRTPACGWDSAWPRGWPWPAGSRWWPSPPWRPWPTSTGTPRPPLRRSRRREGAAVRRPLRAQGGGPGMPRPGGCPGSGARWPCSPRTSWPGAWRQSGAPARLWRALPAPDRPPAGRGCPERALRLPRAALRRPAFLAELALLRLAAGAVGDPAPLQPLYLRRPADHPPHLTGPPVAPSPPCRQGRTM